MEYWWDELPMEEDPALPAEHERHDLGSEHNEEYISQSYSTPTSVGQQNSDIMDCKSPGRLRASHSEKAL